MKRIALDVDQLIKDYLAGESVNALAKRLGVERIVIDRRLRERQVPIRGRAEAERLKWSTMTAAQRQRQTAAAHRAVRGVPQPLETRMKKAQTLQRQGRLHAGEQLLLDMLTAHGVPVIPQEAIGPYNCDLGAAPIAVEIFGGYWHWHGRHAARLPKRLDYICHAGWSIVVVHLAHKWPLTDAAAAYITAYREAACCDPSLLGEYRVIRGTGEHVSTTRP